jgi:hypothetical protein
VTRRRGRIEPRRRLAGCGRRGRAERGEVAARRRGEGGEAQTGSGRGWRIGRRGGGGGAAGGAAKGWAPRRRGS